jgi:cyclohexanone monooxygenase
VVEFTEKGIRTTEKEWEFDYIFYATGFDALTGGFMQMNMIGKDGISLNEKWGDGVKTYLGLCVSGFQTCTYSIRKFRAHRLD